MSQRDDFAGQLALIEALRNPAVFGGGCRAVEVVETHISWVLLTGTHAYKIKKALTLPFLDFGSLAARRRFCEEELRLNRRLAPALYVDVAAITGSAAQPVIDGPGPAIEYAVRMHQFDPSALLSRVAARGELAAADIDALAAAVATFHERIAVAPPEGEHGRPEEILRFADDNFRQIAAAGDDFGEHASLARLRAWTRREYVALRPVFDERRRAGCVRECHGDLHLANVARIDGAITIFDGIEYSAPLRWIDVASEIGFTVMDLEDRGQRAFAHRFLNAYLETSGDYGALAVLRFYVVYRALVRAKVARMRAGQLPPGVGQDELRREFRDYVDLALCAIRPSRPAILLTRGFSGSGKTTCMQGLLEALGAVRVRSDVERKRLAGLPPGAASASPLHAGLYAAPWTRTTYHRLRDLARCIARSGRIAIVDATSLAVWQRELFRELAAELGVAFAILDFRAPEATLRARVAARSAAGGDASEADLAVLDAQQRTAEALTEDELRHTLRVDTSVTLAAVAAGIERRVVDLLEVAAPPDPAHAAPA